MTCHQPPCNLKDCSHFAVFFFSCAYLHSRLDSVHIYAADLTVCSVAVSSMDVTTTYTRHAAQRRSPMLTRAGEEQLTAVHRPVTSKEKSPGECSNRPETRASLHTSAKERSSSTIPGESLPKFKGICCCC